MSMREEFEKWVNGTHYPSPTIKLKNGEYENIKTHIAWEAYQAGCAYQTEKDMQTAKNYSKKTKCICGDEIADEING